MTFFQSNGLKYFSFDNLVRAGVKNAIFTRKGGVSPFPWRSLNLNWYSGDNPDRVAENHRRAFLAVGRDLLGLCDARQIHGSDVYIYKQPPTGEDNVSKPEADALLTNNPRITLGMRFADCVPIMVYDPRNRIIGIVHSGWRGTVQRVAAAAVTKMKTHFGSEPSEILAGIGPSICVDHYEVGSDVVEKAEFAFRKDTPFLVRGNGRIKFNLWEANKQILKDVGVRSIEIAEICTACDLNNWFSYRAENQKTGGFAAIIGLEDSIDQPFTH